MELMPSADCWRLANMRTFVYIALGAALLALAMLVSGPSIKAHGKAWRAHNQPIGGALMIGPGKHWTARI